jgi:hypothetical protein
LPPLRLGAGSTLELSRRASQRLPGLTVDGIALQALDAGSAADQLSDAGVERVNNATLWMTAHRATTSDPGRVDAVIANKKRDGLVGWLILVAVVLNGAVPIFFGSGSVIGTDWPFRWWTWPWLLVSATVIWGGPGWARQRAKQRK